MTTDNSSPKGTGTPTPGPWYLDGSMTGPHSKFVEMICGGEDGAHPTMFLESICLTQQERRQLSANAELIVKAVNGFEKMREALQAIIACDDDHEAFSLFGLADSVDNNGDPYPSQYLADVLAKCRAALAEADTR